MKFEITQPSPRANRSLIIAAAAAVGIAYQESATPGTAELADGTKPYQGFLTVAVTDTGPVLADHVFPGRLDLPVKTGQNASLEFAEVFEAEGDQLYSGTGQITSATALKTKCGFKDGKIRVAQTGEYAEFMLVEKGMTADTAGQLRCRFETINGEIA